MSASWNDVANARRRKDADEYLGALDAWRIERLRPQIAYCFENEYYRAKMKESGIQDPRDIRTMDDFRALPAFMTKELHRESQRASLEKYGHPFGLHLCCPVESVIHVAGTSGTTGLPTFYLFTKRDLELTYKVLHRTFQFASVMPGDSVLVLYGLSMWVAGLTKIGALEAYGATPIPLGAEAGISKALKYIDMCRPRAIFGTPSIISRLAARSPDELGRSLAECGIEIVVAGGEPGLAIPSVRRRLAKATGARLYDTSAGAWLNGAMDCGGDGHNGLHYLAEDYCFRYDLSDTNTGRPVVLKDGAEGEAIHTGLTYEAAPALRYATGDVLRIRVGECPNCGFFGTRFTFVGRSDDLMNIAGVKVYPGAIRSVVEAYENEIPGPMQIVLHAPPPRVPPPVRIDVEAAESSDSVDLGARIERRIHQMLGIRCDVRLVPLGSLPRSNQKTRLVRIEET